MYLEHDKCCVDKLRVCFYSRQCHCIVYTTKKDGVLIDRATMESVALVNSLFLAKAHSHRTRSTHLDSCTGLDYSTIFFCKVAFRLN